MATDARILLVQEFPDEGNRLRDFLNAEGYRLQTAADEHGLRERISRGVPDVVLLDADGEQLDALALVGELKDRFEFLPVIVMTGARDASLVAEGMRRGAFDFLSKPVEPTRVEIAVRNAVRVHRLMIRVNQLQSQYQRRGQFMGLVGTSPAMQTIYSIIENVGGTDVTVFVTGASGTGKELIARAIHDISPRSEKRFVAINCAAIPRELMESELFGHERGSFTGATARYRGCCEQADHGTLFLDEICEMEVGLQSKLLRFLQERRFNRLGGKEEVTVDVRVLAATNRDPLEQVRAGRLREDLYYRLNVVPVEVPPLKDRREDIPLLANLFLERFSAKHGKYFYDFSPEAMGALLAHDWPGNVREIENTVERIVVLNSGAQVTASMLPPSVLEGDRSAPEGRDLHRGDLGPDGVILPMEEIEKRAIRRALSICDGNVAQAARRLQIGQATLYRKIKKFGLVSLRGARGR